MFDMLIKHGLVSLPGREAHVDIAVQDGSIAALGDFGSAEAREVIDAKGLLVLPGFVDPHVHFMDVDPSLHVSAPDGIFSLSRAAVFGGNTTLLDFAFPMKDQSALESLNARFDSVAGQAALDYAFHVAVYGDGVTDGEALSGLKNHFAGAVKLLLMKAPLTENSILEEVMRAAAQENLVAIVHAEDFSILQQQCERLDAEQRFSIQDLPERHPPQAELQALKRALHMAKKTKLNLYIAHLSCGEALSLVEDARRQGQTVFVETTPHYLTLTQAVYAEKNGACYVCAPPIRSALHQQHLWRGIEDGSIDTLGSDHCGFTVEQKMAGGDDIRSVPFGVAGVETRALALFSEGVTKNRISLRRFVDLVAANPARIFGLYPRKGCIQPGSDADICIMDSKTTWRVEPRFLHFPWGYSPVGDLRIQGLPVVVILRGKILMQDGVFFGKPGLGRYVGKNCV
jgi:dihydropyrimidinase